MSFVSIVASHKYLSVMSDGRVLGREKEVLEEDYQKFKKIGDYGFVAYAGDRYYGEKFAQGLSEFFLGRDYDKVASVAIKSLEKADFNSKDIVIMASFGGVNYFGDIEFYSISSINLTMQKFKPEIDTLSYCFLYNQAKENNIQVSDRLVGYLKEIGYGTPSQAIQAQKLTNNYVAKNDVSVNNNTSRLIIRK